MSEINNIVVRMTTKYSGRIKPGVRDDYPESASAMEDLLREWSPLGARMSDLIKIVGSEPEVRDGMYLYIFESGFGGVAWQFTVDNDIIVGARRLTMN